MKIDDERVGFYLRHREQLEEWFALRTEAAEAIDGWLSSLGPELQSVSESYDDVDFSDSIGPEQSYPGFFMKRTYWPGSGREAPVSIGLQWVRGKTLLGSENSPWVVARSHKDNPIGRGLRRNDEFKRIRKEQKHRRLPYWAAFGSVPPENPFPQEADQYRRLLLKSVEEAWKKYSPIVDEVIKGLGSGEAQASGSGP